MPQAQLQNEIAQENSTPETSSSKEPSMEEILASIRRIISEDPAPGEGGAATNEEEEEVLILTEDMMQPKQNAPQQADTEIPGMPIMLKTEEQPGAMNDDGEKIGVIQKPENQEVKMEAEMKPSLAEKRPGLESNLEANDEMAEPALISPKVQQGSLAALTQLQKAMKPQLVKSADSSGLLVETLVRSAIEPMLKDWLENHLQSIVETLVQREIERLGKKAEAEM